RSFLVEIDRLRRAADAEIRRDRVVTRRNRLYPFPFHVRLSTFPGRAPVGLPPRQTAWPLTITVSIPFAACIGFSNVALSSTLSSKSTRSAAKPSLTCPRSARPKVLAVRPVILYTAVSSGKRFRPFE